MKRSLILLLFLVIPISVFSQKGYEAGYYIDQAGVKNEGLIKKENWGLTPRKISFKRYSGSNTIELTPGSVRVVEIEGKVKFIGGNFMVDLASEDLRKITSFSEARLEENQTFLKVLIEGKASLYEYNREGIIRYFYAIDKQEPTQLIYKAFKRDNTVQYNRRYKNQLWEEMKCGTMNLEQVQKLEYFKKDLVDFFIDYNQCQNVPIQDFSNYGKKLKLRIAFRPGAQLSNVNLSQETAGFGHREFDADASIGLRAGVFFEYPIRFSRGKLSLVAEPFFHTNSISANATLGTPAVEFGAEIDYSSLVLPIGVRYYVKNTEKSKLSFTGFVAADLVDFSSTIIIDGLPTLEVNPPIGFVGEIEYKFSGKYGLSLQYGVERDLLSDVNVTTNEVNAKFSYLAVLFSIDIY